MASISQSKMTRRFSNLSDRGNYASFEIHGIDLSVVNGLRRAILADVRTACFSMGHGNSSSLENTIEMNVNTTVLHNEFLAERISLIPIHFNENEFLDIVLDNQLSTMMESSPSM